MNRAPDALVRAAPANIAGHGTIDVLVCWLRNRGQQHRGGDDLTGLTVSALWHLFGEPRTLQRVTTVLRQSLDGRHGLASRTRHGRDTRSHGVAFQNDGARRD